MARMFKGEKMKTDKFLNAGVHIGTKYITGDMRPFVFATRQNGLFILDVEKIKERMTNAAKILSKYEGQNVLIVATRLYAAYPAKKMAEKIGAKVIVGRFMPGTFTNPESDYFTEPDIVLVADPLADRQAVKEAREMNIPVIAFCDTNNLTKDIDYIIPMNNKGRKSLGFGFYTLTQQILENKGLKMDEEEWESWVYNIRKK